MNYRLFNRITEISYALKGKYQTGRAFHVSALIDKNRILSLACNNYFKTHPKTLELPYFNKHGERYEVRIHSELACLIKFGEENCSGLTMINLRINGNNQLDNSAPCSGCQFLLNQVGIRKIFYTDSRGTFQRY